MIDFQTIFIRDVADLNMINFIAVLRVEVDDTAGVSSVLVNGLESKYIKDFGGRVLFVHLPVGVGQDGVRSVRVKTGLTTESGIVETVNTVYESESYLSMESDVNPLTDENINPVSFYGGVLQLRGDDFSNAQRVKINGTDVPFSVVSKSEIMCSLPANAASIDRVDVITTSKTINRRTFFEYMVGEIPGSIAGTQKLIQQFIKVLLTTKGSDVFNPTQGASLQSFVGTNFSPSNPSSIVAQVTLRVIQAGIEMSLQQLVAGIPGDERLSDVQVLGVSIDPDDPTIMEMSLKLNTYSGRSTQFSAQLGDAFDAIESTTNTLNSTLSGSGSSGY